MSSDNTVVVLKTKGKNGSEAEYHVAHVFGMEDMTLNWDYPSLDKPVLNRAWTLEAFWGARVFTNGDEALAEAARLKELVGYVEYGVKVIDHSTIFFPASDRKRRQRRFMGRDFRRPYATRDHHPTR